VSLPTTGLPRIISGPHLLLKNALPAHLNVAPVFPQTAKHVVYKTNTCLYSYTWLGIALQSLTSMKKSWESLQVATEEKRLWNI